MLGTVPSRRARPPAQCLLPPGAWLVVQLEVVSVSPGLCSPPALPSVAQPTGRLEAERGRREERLSERKARSQGAESPPSPSPA